MTIIETVKNALQTRAGGISGEFQIKDLEIYHEDGADQVPTMGGGTRAVLSKEQLRRALRSLGFVKPVAGGWYACKGRKAPRKR
jgi:hypothetical protein